MEGHSNQYLGWKIGVDLVSGMGTTIVSQADLFGQRTAIFHFLSLALEACCHKFHPATVFLGP
jgi:hypothetical protein